MRKLVFLLLLAPVLVSATEPLGIVPRSDGSESLGTSSLRYSDAFLRYGVKASTFVGDGSQIINVAALTSSDSAKLAGLLGSQYALATATDVVRTYADATFATITNLNATAVATGTINTSLLAVAVSTGTLATITSLNATAVATGTINTTLLAVAVSTGNFYTKTVSDATYATRTATDTVRTYADATFATRTATETFRTGYADLTYAVRTATDVVRTYADATFPTKTDVGSSTSSLRTLLNATGVSTGTINSTMLAIGVSTGTLLTNTSAQATYINKADTLTQSNLPVWYSSTSIQFSFSSTSTTVGYNQQTDLACLPYDFTPTYWCTESDAAISFTVVITTAIYANTPSYGNSISGATAMSSPNAVNVISSSGTWTGGLATIPSGRRVKCTLTQTGGTASYTYVRVHGLKPNK
jgi:hypothetical protein